MLKKRQFCLLFIFILLINSVTAYNPELYELEGIDYSLTYFGDMEKDGYQPFSNNDGSFKWKIDAYLPEDMPFIGLGPFTPKIEVVMHIKEISDGMVILVPTRTRFEGRTETKIVIHEEQEFYEVKGVEELEITIFVEGHSFLGNYMFEPPPHIIALFGKAFGRFNTIIVHIPKNGELLDYNRQVRAVLLNDLTIVGHSYNRFAIIYVNPQSKMLIQVGLAVITLLFVFLAIKWQKIIRGMDFRSRHIFFAYLICFMLMMQLAFIFPNPFPINVETGESLYVYTEGRRVPYYMNFIVGLTDSFDSVNIKDFEWCEDNTFTRMRQMFLPFKSARTIFISTNIEDPGDCTGTIVKIFGKEKIKFFNEETQLGEELRKLSDRHYPHDFAFGFMKRFIFFMFMVAGFFAVGMLFLVAFEIDKLDKLIYLGGVILLIASILRILSGARIILLQG